MTSGRGMVWRLAIFAAAAVVFGAAAWQVGRQLRPTGDEPHYLLLTHSLVYDHDLELRNNYLNHDYRAFYQGELDPHVVSTAPSVAWRSFHAPGLAFLLLPGYALAGWPGAAAILALGFAFLAVELTVLLRWLGRPPTVALLAAAAVLVTPPVLFYSGRPFPETVAAIVTVVVVRRALDQNAWGGTPLAAVGLAVLPWLHVKFLALAGFLAIVLWHRSRRFSALYPLGLSVGLLSAYTLWFYESPWPTAISAGTGIVPGVIPYGLPGLLFDEEFGLLWNGPLAMLGFVGIVWTFRKQRLAASLVLGVFSICWVVGSSPGMWWGGLSFAPRFLVPAIPLLAIPLAALPRRPFVAAIAGLVAIAAIFLAVRGLAQPGRMLNYGIRESFVLLDLGDAGRQLAAVLPSFVHPDPRWKVLPAPDLAGDIGEVVPDAHTLDGVSRVAPAGTGAFVVKHALPTVRRGRTDIRIRYWAKGRVAVAARAIAEITDPMTRSAILSDALVTAPPEGLQELILTVQYPGAILLGAPATIRIEVRADGNGEIGIADVSTREPIG